MQMPKDRQGSRNRRLQSHSSDDINRRLLTTKEAANLLGISKRKVWELGNRGEIPCVRIDRALRFDLRDLESAIQTWKQRGTADA